MEKRFIICDYLCQVHVVVCVCLCMFVCVRGQMLERSYV